MKNKTMICMTISVVIALLIVFSVPNQVILFTPLALFIITFEFIRKKERGWDFLTLFNATYFMCYILAPVLLILYPNKISHYVDIDTNSIYYAIFIVYLAYFVFLVSYFFFGKSKVQESIKREIDGVAVQKKIYIFAWIFLIIGTTSFLIYAQIYGGIISLYKQSSNIRSGLTADSDFLFLNSLNNFVVISSWLFTSYFYYQKKRTFNMFFISSVSILISMVIIFSKAGRLSLAFCILPILFAPYYIKNKKPSKILILAFSLIFIIWTAYGKLIFNSISYDNSIMNVTNNQLDYLFLFIREFVHPFVSLQLAISSKIDLRYFHDVVDGIIVILPKRLIGIDMPPSISYYNTYLTTGEFKSEVPPGIVGYFYYCFKIGGIVLGSALLGFIFKKIELWFVRKRDIHPIYVYYYIGIGFTLIYWVMQGDPRVLSQSYYYVFASIIIIQTYIKLTDRELSKKKINEFPLARKYFQQKYY